MALADVKTQLDKLAQSGSLTLAQVGSVVSPLCLALSEMPFGSQAQLASPQIQLNSDQTQLTVQGAGTWNILQGVSFGITITPDPSKAGAYLVALQVQLPSSATLAIPGVPWFHLGEESLSFSTYTAADYRIALVPSVAVTIGATLHIEHDAQDTPIPIAIEMPTGGEMVLRLNTSAIDFPSINDILAAFGDTGGIHLPDTINDLTHLSLQQLSVGFDPSAPSVTLIGVQIGNSAKAATGWQIIPGVLELDSYSLGLTIAYPLVSAQRRVGGLIAAHMKLGTVGVDIFAQHPPSGGWQFRGEVTDVPIGDIISGICQQFGVTLPDTLHQFVLKDFVIAFDSATGQTDCSLVLDFTIADKPFELNASMTLAKGDDGKYKSPTVHATLTVGTATFTGAFDNTAGSNTFSLGWQDKQHPLTLADLTSTFGLGDTSDISSALHLELDAAKLIYSFGSATSGSTFVLEANAPYYGSAAFAIIKTVKAGKSGWQFYFGVAVGTSIDISSLPLIGAVLGGALTVAIQKIQILLSSDVIDAGEAATLTQLIGSGYPVPPTAGMSAKALISANAQFGDTTIPLSLSLGNTAPPAAPVSEAPVPAAEAGALVAAGDGQTNAVPASTSSDNTVWLSVQKTFGPLAVEKIGVQYDSDRKALFIVANLTLKGGGLTIGLVGLGIGTTLTPFSPAFTIKGVDITFQEGPVLVSGGLLGTLAPVNFVGELIVQLPEISLFALGAYAQFENRPSMFLYATLNYPLGGPPFFFVTGLAAGFGYNRKLQIPPVSGVATFPLVEWARGTGSPQLDPKADIGKQVNDALQSLLTSGVIAPSIGDYWLAAGIHFTSFEIIDSFALLTVCFGTDFEVALLGLSTMTLPPSAAPGEPVVVRVELELEASYTQSSGLLAIAGELTQNSFLFSPDCHLTGGFAFYLWLSGPHADDFVITLGGYNPHFDPPAWYPQVPRLGVNWQVTPEFSIKAGLYFALTSSAVMAGGSLDAVWQSGGIRAWFSVWADFLMVFRPFHYYIDAGISLGASFDIDLLFTSVTITIHLGVALEIWGPPFAGRATIDLAIISFTITFGDGGAQTTTTIPWQDFAQQLLPKPRAAQSKLARAVRGRALQAATTLTGALGGESAVTADPPNPTVLHVNVTGGLSKTISQDPSAAIYVVNAEQLECTITSAIPLKAIAFSDNKNIAMAPPAMQPHDQDGQLIVPNTQFGVGPVGTGSGAFSSTLTFTVATTEPSASTFYVVDVLQGVPKALWQVPTFDAHGVPQVGNPLQQTTLPDVITGVRLVPMVPTPDHLLPIPIENLQYTIDPKIQPFAWSRPSYATTDPFTHETVAGTIGAAPATANRPSLITAMQQLGLPVSATVDVGTLANPATNDLLAAPLLRLLGEQRA